MREGRQPLLVAVWLGTALCAGVVTAWLLRIWPDRVVEYRDRAATPAPGHPGPAVSTPVPTENPRSPAAPVPKRTAEESTDVLRNAGGAVAWIEASAHLPDGTLVRGYVYALPAGSPGAESGAEWRRTPRVVLEPPGPCRLGLPDEGEYDVGFLSSRPTTSVVIPSLRLARGQVLPVAFQVPAGRPVTFVADSSCDPVLPGRDGGVFLVARLRTEDPGQRSLPGAGEPVVITEQVSLHGAGPWKSNPLPVDREFHVRGGYSATLDPSSMDLRERLVLSASTVRAGDVVRLSRKPAAGVQLRFGWKSAPPPAWRGETSVEGRILAAGESLSFDLGSEWDASGVGACHLFLLCPPGPARVEWTGSGILPGSLTTDLGEGDSTRLELPLEADPAAVLPVREPVRVVVEAVPPGPDRGGDRSVEFSGVLPRVPGKEPGKMDADFGPGEDLVLEGEWRGVRDVVVRSGRWLVSRPRDVPAGGDYHVRLEPAGYLLVVPDTLISLEMGALQVHSREGWMYVRRVEDTYPEVVEDGPTRRTHVETVGHDRPDGGGLDLLQADSARNGAGVLLGPFPEGTYTFDVRLGGVRLPDATVTVRAGRIEVLRILTKRE